MENESVTLRILRVFIVVLSCAAYGFASGPLLPQPVATLVMLPSGQGESASATVAFSSETSIAVGVCLKDCVTKTCSLFLVQWEGGTLRLFAQTQRFDSGVSIHPASKGQILTVGGLSPTVLYSADLSTSHDLPEHVSRVSLSGKTAAEWANGSWKLYRLTDGLELLREGTGDLQSVSDEVVVIQDGKVIRVETLDGKRLGSFPVPPQGYYQAAAPLGSNKLYLDDCKSVRVVNFEGRTQLKMRPRKGCSMGDTGSSADGNRMLFDFTSRKVSGLQSVLDGARTVATLGMVGAEDFNREQIRVIDTVTGKSCFEWHHNFLMTYSQVRSAAISPSGEFIAIAAGNALSIYHLPAVCEGQAITSDR